MDYFSLTRIFGQAKFYAWISPFNSHIILKRLYLGLKILNMNFCNKLERVVNHALLRKFFTPKSCSRKLFHFSHVCMFVVLNISGVHICGLKHIRGACLWSYTYQGCMFVNSYQPMTKTHILFICPESKYVLDDNGYQHCTQYL